MWVTSEEVRTSQDFKKCRITEDEKMKSFTCKLCVVGNFGIG